MELQFQYLKFRADKQDFKNKSVTKLCNIWRVKDRKRGQFMDRQRVLPLSEDGKQEVWQN